jgi:nitrogen fixation-related uncharacterized protein
MRLTYLAVVALVAIAVALLFYTTVSQHETYSDEEITDLGNDINSVDNLLGQFDTLDNMDLSEVNDSLFNH